MASDFVHLHLHSHYSLLDGACTIKGLVEMANKYDMKSVAITDHGFMGWIGNTKDEFRATAPLQVFSLYQVFQVALFSVSEFF